MKNQTLAISPQLYARIGGVLYLIIIVLGAAGEFVVRGRIIVPGDVATTAANLRLMEPLWRFGIAAELVLGICSISLALILYVLLRPVNQELALLAAFFNIIAIAMEMAYALQLHEVLFLQGSAAYLKAFTPDQLNAMTNLALKAHGEGFGMALLMFGCFCPIVAYLIFKSGYFPKVIGILFFIAGLSYTISSFALILAPAFANRFYFVMAGPAVIGEAALCLWLLVKGVNLVKWQKRMAEWA